MSDLSDKLDATDGTPGRARAKLRDLRQSSSAFTLFGDTVTRVTRMGLAEVWTRVPGTGRGETSWFELEEEKHK